MSEINRGDDAAQLARALMVTADRLDAAITKLHGGNTNTVKIHGAGGVLGGMVLGLAVAAFLWTGWALSDGRARSDARFAELDRRLDRQEDYQNTVFQMIPEIRDKVAANAAEKSPHDEAIQQ